MPHAHAVVGAVANIGPEDGLADVRVEVHNEGVPIEPSVLENLFDPLQRGPQNNVVLDRGWACISRVKSRGFAERQNAAMSRFVFFTSAASSDAKALTAAKKIAKAHGATIVRATASSMLLEGSPEIVKTIAASLPTWRYEPERFYRLPETPSPWRRKLAATLPPKKPDDDTTP